MNQKPVDDKDEVDEVLGSWLEWLPLEVTELVDITQEQWSELKKDLNAHFQKKYLGLLKELVGPHTSLSKKEIHNGRIYVLGDPQADAVDRYKDELCKAIDEAIANIKSEGEK